MSRTCLSFVALTLLFAGKVTGFLPTSPTATNVSRPKQSELQESSGGPSRKKEQEMVMEELSRIGAERIASLSISERTKRAMLAEAIEDRIFDLTDELDSLIVDNTIPVENREKVVELAKQTKTLQIQYEELVSGKSSSVLDSLEAATETGGGGGTKEGSDSN